MVCMPRKRMFSSISIQHYRVLCYIVCSWLMYYQISDNTGLIFDIRKQKIPIEFPKSYLDVARYVVYSRSVFRIVGSCRRIKVFSKTPKSRGFRFAPNR